MGGALPDLSMGFCWVEWFSLPFEIPAVISCCYLCTESNSCKLNFDGFSAVSVDRTHWAQSHDCLIRCRGCISSLQVWDWKPGPPLSQTSLIHICEIQTFAALGLRLPHTDLYFGPGYFAVLTWIKATTYSCFLVMLSCTRTSSHPWH